jgi:hypothetical protein
MGRDIYYVRVMMELAFDWKIKEILFKNAK